MYGLDYKTSRERPKSAPYPRLKNSKRTSKFPSIGELGLLLWKKVSQCRKKLKGRTLWDFSTSILLQNSKKIEGGPFVRKKVLKSRTVPKKWTLWSRPVLYVTRETFFWFSSLGQQVHFGVFWKFCRTFARTILVSSGGLKKTLTKSHDYSRLFSEEKRRLKIKPIVCIANVLKIKTIIWLKCIDSKYG